MPERSTWRHAGRGADRQQPDEDHGTHRKRRYDHRASDDNQRHILTGSQADGRAFTDNADHTSHNWTSSTEGAAQIGHPDNTGGPNTSWNSAHASRGCSQDNLKAMGGAGLFYCFAVDKK